MKNYIRKLLYEGMIHIPLKLQDAVNTQAIECSLSLFQYKLERTDLISLHAFIEWNNSYWDVYGEQSLDDIKDKWYDYYGLFISEDAGLVK